MDSGAERGTGAALIFFEHLHEARSRIEQVNKVLKKGDHVEWTTSQGKTAGIVKKKLVSKTKIKTHTVAASKEDPQYLVESKKTGGLAAHKPAALKKR